jgi:Flp pilus assembly protein TadB
LVVGSIVSGATSLAQHQAVLACERPAAASPPLRPLPKSQPQAALLTPVMMPVMMTVMTTVLMTVLTPVLMLVLMPVMTPVLVTTVLYSWRRHVTWVLSPWWQRLRRCSVSGRVSSTSA